MKRINEDIKTSQFKNIYLLCGEEDYLRKQYRDKLRDALSDGDSMNCHYFEGKDVNVGEVIDLAETLPFFADRRVIVIENSGFIKKGGEQLADYLTDMPESSYIILVETEVDKRSRLYKTVKDKGYIAEFTVQDEATLYRWIAGLLAKDKKKISNAHIRYFLEKTGTDMSNIKSELEKLVCYALDREVITAEDIDAVCTRKISNQIFDMVDAVAGRNQKKALDLYYDLLSLKEPPMRILFLLARQFNLLMQVKAGKKRGESNQRIAEQTGLRPFLVDKYAAAAARLENKKLRAALEACVEAEECVKTGKLNDVMSVELLIIEYSK